MDKDDKDPLEGFTIVHLEGTNPHAKKFSQAQLTDMEALQNPGTWPMWPVMPMKRKNLNGDPFSQCGTLLSIEGLTTTVILDGGEILWSTKCAGKTWGEIVKMFPTQKYDSLEAILNDGWRCD